MKVSKGSLERSLLWAQQHQLSQSFLLGKMLQLSDHLCGAPLELLQQESLYWGPQNWVHYFGGGS